MNNFRYGLVSLAIAAAFGSGTANALDDKRFYIAPMGSYVLSDDDRHADDGYGGTLAIGTQLSEAVSIELRGFFLDYGDREIEGGLLTPDTSEGMDVSGGGVGVNWYLAGSSAGGLYLHGDVMASENAVYNAGLGFDLPFTKNGIALRAEALYHYEKYESINEVDSDFHEPLFNLGIKIPFGAAPVAPPPRPEPVAVVPVAPPPPKQCSDSVDNDGDGLIDFPADPGCHDTNDADGIDAQDDDETNKCEMPAPGQPMNLEGCAVGDTIVLQGVTFEFDKARLTPNAKVILDGVAAALTSRPDIKVELGGHTDAKGSDAYNLKLSDRRSASVKEYLVSKGVAAERMSSRGYGEAVPVADNATDEGRELNRRVELKVTESGGSVTVAPTVRTAENAAPLPASAPVPPVPPPAEPPAPAAASANTVTIIDFAFAPETITVPVGTTVTWTNKDGSNHFVAFPDQQSDRLRMDSTYTRTFTQPGVYEYACTIHPQMKGKVVVE